MHGAETMCNSQAPTNVAQMLGLDARYLDALAPQQWFQNPCGPALFDKEYVAKNGPSGAHSLSPDPHSKNGSSERPHEDSDEDDDRRMSF